ncbi:hypothetical protein [Natronorubrum halophilum]|uniref:hypothetical protein n=1 Tax=Natronorubrum halophilum TaxID=1702106 RepID=UPI001EE83ADF|nr:hypothetical protein [Natronorubrum halophilum]
MTGPRISRREILGGGAASGLAGLAGCIAEADVLGMQSGSDGPTLAVLEDRSQDFALTGTPKYRTTIPAIEEINRNGGILGEEIDVFAPDP